MALTRRRCSASTITRRTCTSAKPRPLRRCSRCTVPARVGISIDTTIATELTALEQADLLAFLKSIDGTTARFRSEGDEFRDALRLQGTCPPLAPVNGDVKETEKSESTDPTPVMGAPAGTFTLVEEFCNTGPNKLTLLQSVTTTLTGGNILLNRDGGTPAGVGSVLTFPSTEGFADRILDPGECVTVTYKIGLQSGCRFQILRRRAGEHCRTGPTAQAQAAALTTRVSANQEQGDGRSIEFMAGDDSLEFPWSALIRVGRGQGCDIIRIRIAGELARFTELE